MYCNPSLSRVSCDAIFSNNFKRRRITMSINSDIPHDRIQQNDVWKVTPYDTGLHKETRYKTRTTDSLLGTSAGELSHGLGALRDRVLSKFTRENQSHGGLDLTRGNSGLLGVRSEF